MEEEFRDVWRQLDISFDDFIRTTEPRHQPACRSSSAGLTTPATSTRASTKGWYCVGCEAFKQEKDLVDGKCPIHPTTKPEWIREKNYFFRLSKYQRRCSDHFAAHPEFLEPDIRRNEILRLLESGLEDISVSRAGQSWGIPMPYDPSSVVYVWFDALDQLRVRGRASARDDGAVREVVAGRSARHRQGHHALSHRHLAGDADERRSCRCRGRCSATGS